LTLVEDEECQHLCLYYHCDEIFPKGHECKEQKLFFIDMVTKRMLKEILEEYMANIDLENTKFDGVPTQEPH
jgi:hypothetical protein